MASRERDEYILQCCGMGAQLCERDILAVQFREKRRHREMQFRDLKFHSAVLCSNVANSFDAAQRGNIEGVRIGARGKRNQMLRADRGDQFARRAESDLSAVVHDGDAFAEALGFVHVMRGEKDGAAGGFEFLDQIPKLAAGLGIEAGGGLVQKKKIGIANQGTSESEALLLTARKISNARILFFLKLHERNGFGRARPPVKKAAEQTECFEDGELFRELRILQLNAEPLAELSGIGIPVETKKFDVTGIRCGQAFTDFNSRRFARSVRPKKSKTFACAHLEIQAVDGDHVLVSLSKTADAKGSLGGVYEHETSIASRGDTFKPSLRLALRPIDRGWTLIAVSYDQRFRRDVDYF